MSKTKSPKPTVECICRRWVRQQKPVVEVTGTIDDDMEFPVRVTAWAAAPVDRNQSFSGSGLPFANPEMAFTNNSVVLDNYNSSDFKVTLLEPNAFYEQGGAVYVPPTVFVRVESISKPSMVAYSHKKLDEIAVPYRALQYTMPKDVAQRKSCEFYAGREKLPQRTQYQILLDSAYPCKDTMAKNFWGQKPPQ